MERDKIIDKIVKCLRLAESGNPNEAAAALRQAHSMMRKYGIREADIEKLAIRETTAGSGGYYNPPYWALALSELIAEAFECRVYLARREMAHPQFRFIGLEHRARVSAYSFTVLYRQLRLARRNYMRSLALDDRHELRRLGNVFAQAWLYRIARVVAEFHNESGDQRAVDDYVRQHYGETTESLRDYTDPDSRDYDVILSGMRAAQGVLLFRPVKTDSSQKLATKACA